VRIFATLRVSGEGDGDDDHQPKQGPAGGPDRAPATARGPAEEGDAAEGSPRETPRLRHEETAIDQPGADASIHSGQTVA